ncbi:MAG: heat-inducible transcriptional repressor HrcA [Deltaproteobacteria bacterium]
MITSERVSRILSAVVQDYIQTAEPVSSKTISRKYPLGLSPATIRNIMAELEEDGFLRQPHTSAGRVPTEKGFRFYVDSLPKLEDLAEGEKDIIRRSCGAPCAMENILADTAKALSALTGCAGLMFAPRKDSFTIKHIRILPMDSASLMVLLVSSIGLVQTRLVRMDSGVKGLDLEKISNYLNSIAWGLTVRELRLRIIKEMRVEKNLYDKLMAKALNLGVMAFEDGAVAQEGDIYVEGKVNVFEQPEFRDDFERMKRLFDAFEEKSLLVKILDKSMDSGGIHIYLGSESAVEEFRGLSFVTAPYGRDGEILGTLGVIGPVRMNYSRIIPLVDYTAGLLSKVFY